MEVIGGGGAAVDLLHHDEAADAACALGGAGEVIAPGAGAEEDGVERVEGVFFDDVPAVVDEVGGGEFAPAGDGPFPHGAGDAAVLTVVGVGEGLGTESGGVRRDAQEPVFAVPDVGDSVLLEEVAIGVVRNGAEAGDGGVLVDVVGGAVVDGATCGRDSHTP